jgi:hypothetical protein
MNSSTKIIFAIIFVATTLQANAHLTWFSEEDTNSKDYQGVMLPESWNLNVSGEVIARHESWDWFGDTTDSYDFQFQRSRLNLDLQADSFELFVQPQWVSMWNLPDDAVSTPPAGPSGMGALYYAHNGDTTLNSIGLHQAYLQFKKLLNSDTKLTLGRMTYDGIDYRNKEDGQKFNNLKNMRLADRLLSSFEWAAFARSFDGLRAETSLYDTYLTASWFYPTESGWERNFNETMEDVRIATLGLTLPKGKFLENAEISVFFNNYKDERECTQRIDNSGISLVDETDIDIHVLGAHLVSIQKAGAGQWDYLVWGAYEWGDWYELDHKAYAFTAETGYQWVKSPWKPWVRVGYFIGSGDGDAGDGNHETFFQLTPGTRKYQLFPYYDLQNNESLYLQTFLFPTSKLKIRLDFAINSLSESEDRWYMGTGATQEAGNIFGYLGRPSGGSDDLSKEASITLMYQYREHLSFEAFYAHSWAGNVIENIYPESSDADYFFIQTSFKF